MTEKSGEGNNPSGEPGGEWAKNLLSELRGIELKINGGHERGLTEMVPEAASEDGLINWEAFFVREGIENPKAYYEKVAARFTHLYLALYQEVATHLGVIHTSLPLISRVNAGLVSNVAKAEQIKIEHPPAVRSSRGSLDELRKNLASLQSLIGAAPDEFKKAGVVTVKGDSDSIAGNSKQKSLKAGEAEITLDLISSYSLAEKAKYLLTALDAVLDVVDTEIDSVLPKDNPQA